MVCSAIVCAIRLARGRILNTPKAVATIDDSLALCPSDLQQSRQILPGVVSRSADNNHVLTFDMFANKTEADIEDVMGWRTYLALVNSAYGLDAAIALNEHEIANERVIKKVEDKFRTVPVGTPEFDHFEPAE
jgi:hypothetical protein